MELRGFSSYVSILYLISFLYLYLSCKDRLAPAKYLSNHFLLLAPVNFLLILLSKGKGRRKTIFEVDEVPNLGLIKENYGVIQQEAKALLESGVFRRPPSADEPGYNSFEKRGWRKFQLKWYKEECRDLALETCPETCSLLARVPAIRSAMFTLLPSNGRLGRHHDPLATTLRYHIGLVTPNSDECALTLNGDRYPFYDGEDLLFDQTFLHSAVNRTDQQRVILFCDVENPQLRGFGKFIARMLNDHVIARLTGADDKGKIGIISRAYMPIYWVRSFVKKKIKPKSLLLYNLIKFSFILAILMLIFTR